MGRNEGEVFFYLRVELFCFSEQFIAMQGVVRCFLSTEVAI